MLPNFMIVGAPKAATTSLYQYLCQHPDIFMSTPKEVNYFSHEEISSQNLFYTDFKVRSVREYESLFADANGFTAVGEASVSYLFYPETPAKIKALLPDVKIIILLRNPMERGFSHYLMDYRLGLCPLSYEDIVFNTSNHPLQKLYYQQYVELGLYSSQLERYFSCFPRENIRIYLQEDLLNEPELVLRELFGFLNVSDEFNTDLSQSHNAFSMPKNYFWHKLYSNTRLRKTLSSMTPNSIKALLGRFIFDTRNKPSISPATKEFLLKIYSPDIHNVEKLIGRSLDNWL